MKYSAEKIFKKMQNIKYSGEKNIKNSAGKYGILCRKILKNLNSGEKK